MGKKVNESSGIRHCYGCGKEFYVQWPLMWTYARTEGPRRKYFCSYSCVRKYDKEKGEPKVGGHRKMTKDQEKEAIQIALDGGDPLTFLAKCGINNPPQKWYDIKTAVKETDPDTFAKLPLRIQRKKESETPEAPLPVQDLKLQPGGNYRLSVETPEAPAQVPEEYEFTAIRHKNFGEFYFDHDRNCIDWRTPEGDEMTLSVDGWKRFFKTAPALIKRIGVKL